MKAADVVIGEHYYCKVSGIRVRVRVTGTKEQERGSRSHARFTVVRVDNGKQLMSRHPLALTEIGEPAPSK